MTILYFILALGLLVFVHEFGHFLMAKRQKIGVEKFSLGFGPKLFGFQRGETTYLISALPLGGYVKLKGEDPESADQTDPASYAGRPVADRFRVIFAGPFMNLLLALLFMPIVFMIGRSEPAFWSEAPMVSGIKQASPAAVAGLQVGDRILEVEGKKVENWKELLNEVILSGGKKLQLTLERAGRQETREITVQEGREGQGGMIGVEPFLIQGQEAIVDGLLPGGAAEQAGLQIGDEIIRIGGVPIADWEAMAEQINRSGGEALAVEVKRGDQIQSVQLQPVFEPTAKRWVIGIQKDYEKRGPPMVMRRYPVGQAIALGLKENIKLGQLTFAVVGRLVTFQLSYKTLGGPIRIAQASAMAAKGGLSHFLYFLAFLSLQLGILNLLPIPVLDGGHLLFLGVEKLARRPLPMRIRLAAEQAGFVLLITLMILVTLHDVDSVWGFKSLFEKIRTLF